MVKSAQRGDVMSIGKITNIKIPDLNSFNFRIKHNRITRENHTLDINLHTHNQFEIYINLSGDVSFLVENNLYEINRGDIIISRPGEEHHCIYKSDAPHEMFWILFDCEQNKELLDFLHEGFWSNHISPADNLRQELIDICFLLNEKEPTEEEKIYYFFRIFAILKTSKKALSEQTDLLPYDLKNIIDYIESRICEEISIAEIASNFYISQSALERRFKKVLDMTPLEFIKRRKLTIAARLLQEGKSVLVAGVSVGYNDNSHFIKLFKKYYGITPNLYKKRFNKS